MGLSCSCLYSQHLVQCLANSWYSVLLDNRISERHPAIPSYRWVYKPLVHFPTFIDNFAILRLLLTSLPHLLLSSWETYTWLIHPSLTWSQTEFSSWFCFINSFPWLKDWFFISPKCFPSKIVNSNMLFCDLSFISFHLYFFIPTQPDFKYISISSPFLWLFLAHPEIWFLVRYVQILWLVTSFLTYNLSSFHLPLILSQKSLV